jgi:hypothetical protein
MGLLADPMQLHLEQRRCFHLCRFFGRRKGLDYRTSVQGQQCR